MKPEIYSQTAPGTYFRLPIHFIFLPCTLCFQFDRVPEVTDEHAHRDSVRVTMHTQQQHDWENNVTLFSYFELFLDSFQGDPLRVMREISSCTIRHKPTRPRLQKQADKIRQ